MIGKNQYKWLYISGLFVLLSVVFLVIPATRQREKPYPALEKSPERLIVSKIIDGDTFELSDGSRVRLIGVDTPEINQPFYDRAVALADSLLLDKTIKYETDGEDRDRYGRYLWYVFVDSIFVNEKIINEGLGLVYLFESNLKYAGRLIESQKEARKSGRGLWSLPVPSSEDFYIALRGSYRFHRPLCMSIKGADPGKMIRSASRDSLLDMGLSPCRNCRP